jgi:hypothetical protein
MVSKIAQIGANCSITSGLRHQYNTFIFRYLSNFSKFRQTRANYLPLHCHAGGRGFKSRHSRHFHYNRYGRRRRFGCATRAATAGGAPHQLRCMDFTFSTMSSGANLVG